MCRRGDVPKEKHGRGKRCERGGTEKKQAGRKEILL